MNGEKYIQVGVTALRNPATGEYMPVVPLYVKAESGAAESENGLIEDIDKLLAARMKQYVNACAAAGVTLG